MIPNSGDLDEVTTGADVIRASLERSRQPMIATPAILADETVYSHGID